MLSLQTSLHAKLHLLGRRVAHGHLRLLLEHGLKRGSGARGSGFRDLERVILIVAIIIIIIIIICTIIVNYYYDDDYYSCYKE